MFSHLKRHINTVYCACSLQPQARDQALNPSPRFWLEKDSQFVSRGQGVGAKQVLWYGDAGTQGGGRIDREVRSPALRCQTCSSHVNQRATHVGVLA